MRQLLKVVRAVVMTLLALAIFVPAALYLVLSTPWAQEKIRTIAEKELTTALGTEVSIGKVEFVPFNYVDVENVRIADDYGETALTAQTLETRFEFWNFVTTGRLSFDYAVLGRVDLNLYRRTADSPLNIAQIIEHLKSREPKKEPTKFDLALYTVRLENAQLNYNVLDAPETAGKFDPNHISLADVTLMATAPRISNDEISAKIRQFSFSDKSGLTVNNLKLDVCYTPVSLIIDNIKLELPASRLDLGSYKFEYEDPADLPRLIKENPIDITLKPGSYVTMSDFGWLLPEMKNVRRRFNVTADVMASRDEISLNNLDINEVTDGGFFLNVTGKVSHPLDPNAIALNDIKIDISTFAPSVTDFCRRLERPLPAKTAEMLNRFGRVNLTALATGTLNQVEVQIDVNTALGSLWIEGKALIDNDFKDVKAQATAAIDSVQLGTLLGNPKVGRVSAVVSADIETRKGARPICDITVDEAEIEYSGHYAGDVSANFAMNESGAFDGDLHANVEGATLFLDFRGESQGARPSLAGSCTVSHFNPYSLGLINRYAGYELGFNLDFDLAGEKAKWIDGYVDVSDLSFSSPAGPNLLLKKLDITADNTVRPNIITVTSDYLNGTLEGDLSLLNLIDQIKTIISPLMPGILPVPEDRFEGKDLRNNNFRMNFTLDNAENLVDFFHLPVTIIHPIEMEGIVNFDQREIILGVEAEYLMKGDMIIENTSLQARIGGESDKGTIYLTTQFPTKKGEMVLVGAITAHNNIFSTKLDWSIERDKPIEGMLSFDTEIKRDVDNGALGVSTTFNPCQITFGNDTWTMAPSVVTYRPGYLDVDNFSLASESQRISIDGTCSAADKNGEILITLDKVILDAIFETLDINKALLAGVATGTFHARDIFSGVPVLECDNLHVDDIGYNRCILGDGDIVARWDNKKKSFFLDAVINEGDGHKSFIKGDIFPMTESLDISFVADKVKVGFMKPFIDAFAGDITGYASGRARLFGTFKYIDMEGDIFAEDLGLKIDFTNAWYYATDSIKLRPGLIDIPAVTVRDAEGHTALLSGTVKHNFFKDPVFDFKVTEARNFLSYDVTPNLSPDWYGRIYGNGSAFITGHPGVVNIDVNMSTAEGSVFTFVLSDMVEAEQYNFITFRDKNRNVITDSIIQVDILPPAVREYRDRMRAKALAQNPPSAYNMNIQVDITPEAKMILVMDPVGGDEIKAWGKGNLRMTYASKGNDLRMYGTYEIDRGSYNFTLQDIIVKDFTLKEGSSIAFTGDPYNATLDISAYYALNANLTDLDESFMNDPELNRTNVPVRALLLVRGDMRQPDIDFDLEFPTLTSDIYRKVRSIISTDEMMNRQMIYLLALNRFYTPEYMSATKGSELFSVASSTISSRLSSMLGKLSDNWSISPNLRSDKGDFSDVEFDLALSSNLLNNRLRFNGNFGYRDKSLNTNQFIGDFDLEYLINRTGSWRLKAYNRFNDQTYFLRTAKTTQGVGIKFQRDFDNFFGFLHNRKNTADSVPGPTPDTLPEPRDSVTVSPESNK